MNLEEKINKIKEIIKEDPKTYKDLLKALLRIEIIITA